MSSSGLASGTIIDYALVNNLIDRAIQMDNTPVASHPNVALIDNRIWVANIPKNRLQTNANFTGLMQAIEAKCTAIQGKTVKSQSTIFIKFDTDPAITDVPRFSQYIQSHGVASNASKPLALALIHQPQSAFLGDGAISASLSSYTGENMTQIYRGADPVYCLAKTDEYARSVIFSAGLSTSNSKSVFYVASFDGMKGPNVNAYLQHLMARNFIAESKDDVEARIVRKNTRKVKGYYTNKGNGPITWASLLPSPGTSALALNVGFKNTDAQPIRYQIGSVTSLTLNGKTYGLSYGKQYEKYSISGSCAERNNDNNVLIINPGTECTTRIDLVEVPGIDPSALPNAPVSMTIMGRGLQLEPGLAKKTGS